MGINIPKFYANTFDIGICSFILMIVDFRYDKCIHKNKELTGNGCQYQVYLGKYHVVHSSGSTAPRYFVYDNAAWEQIIPDKHTGKSH